jgi:hypothetical protein
MIGAASRPPGAKAAIIAAGALATIGALASPSPTAVAACGACLALVVFTLWRDLPILLLPALFQWSEVAIIPMSTIWRQVPLSQLSQYRVSLESSTLYGLGGVAALAIGLRLGSGSSSAALSARLDADAAAWRFHDVAGVGLCAIVLGSALSVMSGYAGPARELLRQAGNVHYVGLFALAYWCLRRRSHYAVVAAVTAFEVVLGMTGYFAEFKNALLTLIVAALAARARLRLSDILIVGAAGGLLIGVAIFWSAVKSDYRRFVNGGSGAQIVVPPIGERIGYMGNALITMNGRRVADGFNRLVARHGYTEYLALTMANVPEFRPHEDGQLTLSVFDHVLTPRFLFPDKSPLPSDTAIMTDYTGLRDRWSDNTSISIGYLGELYVDFGYSGGLLAAGIIGALVGAVYRMLARRDDAHALLTAGFCVMATLPIAYFGLAYIKVMGAFASSSAIALALQRMGPRSPAPKPRDRGSRHNRAASSPARG